jgi:hypothetical protein
MAQAPNSLPKIDPATQSRKSKAAPSTMKTATKPTLSIDDLEPALLDIRVIANLLVDTIENGDHDADRDLKIDWIAHQLRDAIDAFVPRFTALHQAELGVPQ